MLNSHPSPGFGQCVHDSKRSEFLGWPQIVDTFSIWMCVPKYVYSRHIIISWLTLFNSRWYMKFNFFFFGPVNWMGGVSSNMFYCI